MAAAVNDCLGPPLLRVKMTTGVETQKANWKAMLIQLIVPSETRKCSEAVFETAEKVNQSQLTIVFSNTNWASPKKRRL